MFYDERIEQTRGKITRNCIGISVIAALMIGGIRYVNVLKRGIEATGYLWHLSLEALISLGGAIILLIGALMGLGQRADERLQSEKANFYKKAGMIQLCIVLAGFSWFLPVTDNIPAPFNFADVPFDTILQILLILIGTYCCHSFKKNEIYFNYAILEEDHYYKAVWRNVGKLWKYVGILLVITLVSLFCQLIFGGMDEARLVVCLLTYLLSYVFSGLALSGLYLLYSYLEKASYDKENAISKATVFSLIGATVLYSLFTILLNTVNQTSLTEVNKMILVSFFGPITFAMRLAFVVFLTYFSFEYGRRKPNQLIKRACTAILLCESIGYLAGAVLDCLTLVYIEEMMADVYLSILLGNLYNGLSDLVLAINIVCISLIIIGLVRDQSIKKGNLFMIGVMVIMCGVELFLRTQVSAIQQMAAHSAMVLAVLVYLCVLLAKVFGKADREELL